MTPLHTSVENLAKRNAALVLSNSAIHSLLLKKALETADYIQSTTVSIPIEGYPQIEARFAYFEVADDFTVTLSSDAGLVRADLNPGFRVGYVLHVHGDPSKEFSAILISVRDVTVRLFAEAPYLMIGTPDFGSSGDVIPSANRSQVIKGSGINERTLEGIEAALAYVLPHRLVAPALATMKSIDLSKHFPALDLRGEWQLYVVDEGLVIIPSLDIFLRDDTGCPLKDSAPEMEVRPGKIEIDPKNKRSATWSLNKKGVPKVDVKNALDDTDGFASLYAPTPLWQKRFEKTLPGIYYRDSDPGFIGWDLTFAAGLRYTGLSVDPGRYGLVVDFAFEGAGFVFLTVDVPCVGRSDLGYARFHCTPSTLRVLLSFVVAPSGKLVLESQIDQLVLGKVDATVSLFGRYLALAGGEAAVLGIIFDYILGRVIEHNVPIKVREAIMQEVNSKNFTLLDLEELESFTRWGFNKATYSGESNSVLVGLVSVG